MPPAAVAHSTQVLSADGAIGALAGTSADPNSHPPCASEVEGFILVNKPPGGMLGLELARTLQSQGLNIGAPCCATTRCASDHQGRSSSPHSGLGPSLRIQARTSRARASSQRLRQVSLDPLDTLTGPAVRHLYPALPAAS